MGAFSLPLKRQRGVITWLVQGRIKEPHLERQHKAEAPVNNSRQLGNSAADLNQEFSVLTEVAHG